MIIHGETKIIASALIKARGEMNATVTKDRKGNFGSYATLAAIVEATTAAFGKHGLAIVQEAMLGEDGVTIATWLIHESGSTIEFTPLTMPLGDRKPQAVGSLITYARRYQLAAVCGLAPDDDDDGQAAQDSTQKPRQATQKAQDKPVDGDVLFDTSKSKISPEQAAIIAHLGQKAYPGEWDANMDKLAEWSSGGARHKIGDLFELEGEKLIKALKKKVEQAA